VTGDGFEVTWAVNYLARSCSHLLLDRVSRVVNVTSAAQGFGRLDLDDLQFERRRYGGGMAPTRRRSWRSDSPRSSGSDSKARAPRSTACIRRGQDQLA